jgi:hypothetical protein
MKPNFKIIQMENYLLVNSDNQFPLTRGIKNNGISIPFSFTIREGKNFTLQLEASEILDHEFDDPNLKREFYSLLFKTELAIFPI